MAGMMVNQVATSTTSAEAVPARPYRKRVILKNIDPAITIYVGEGIETEEAINALSASGTPRLAYIEETD